MTSRRRVCARARRSATLVRFAPRVDEIADAQRRRQRGGQPLGVAHQMLVQVAGVGVEHAHLPLGRVGDARMAVADVRDVVVAVDVAAPGLVEEILHRAADDLHRPAVADADVAADRPAAREDLGVGHGLFAALREHKERVSLVSSVLNQHREI